MGSHRTDIFLEADNTAERLRIIASRAENETRLVGSQPLARQTILYVDSDAHVRDVVVNALPQYELVFAGSGYEALRHINSRVFDLYALDYWLPDWSGISLCRHIRKTDPHVPICFCSSASRPEDQQRATRAGGDAYILKPLDSELLNDQVSILTKARSRCNDGAARRAAFLALAQELERRFAALPPTTICDQLEKSLKRVARSKARAAFLLAGGTLAGFERIWSTLWPSSKTIKHYAIE